MGGINILEKYKILRRKYNEEEEGNNKIEDLKIYSFFYLFFRGFNIIEF